MSLGVAATFANEAERAANVAAAADPATRRRAIELIDVAAWGIVYGRWIASNATAMDTYAREQGQPNFASLTGRTRASVRSAIWTAHSREIKAAMVNDPAIWARLNLVTQGQSTHFLNEANAFAGAHNAVAATGGTLRMGRPAMQFSTPGDLISQVNAVNAAARTALGDPNAAKIRNLGIFTHGWRNGMGGRHGGGGQDIQDPNALASQMSGALTSDVHVGLYACGTAGHGAAEGSFADRLRDALVVDHPDAVVLGHTTEADTVANEEVRIFGGREGMNDANFHRIFPRTLTAPARAEFEAELHRPVSVGDFNRAMIYFYNREFLWTARASDISATNDPTRLQAAAHQWFTSFVREPQWRRAIIARLPGAAPRRNVSRPPRGGAPATEPAS